MAHCAASPPSGTPPHVVKLPELILKVPLAGPFPGVWSDTNLQSNALTTPPAYLTR